MKISAAAILVLCVVIDQKYFEFIYKAMVHGGLLDIFKGKDKALDEASGGYLPGKYFYGYHLDIKRGIIMPPQNNFLTAAPLGNADAPAEFYQTMNMSNALQFGSGYTFRKWLRGTELTFNDPLEYGNYTVHMDFDTPDGKWALGLYFNFVVDENSMCTVHEF
ncbi:Protein of unknown function [Cotesia congregata]|uniref:Uncharacterized protein n=1 Tax=Cotesia congregata TaxID=51543 RepID=A0A8J2MYI7_COTCN|nr:Protein of unknown function [Cotesia congregata]